MRRSRVCLGCGHDTCRCTPYEEKHYGLMVVACDRCGRVQATRRSTGIAQWWRGFARVRDLVVVLVLQLGGLFMAVGGIAGLVQIAERSLAAHDVTPYGVLMGERTRGFFMRLERLYTTGDAYVVMAMVFMCAAVGAWIGTTLRTTRVMHSCLVVAGLALIAGQVHAWLFFESYTRERSVVAINSAVLTCMGAVVMYGGTPLGFVLHNVWREASRVAFGWKLGRARKRRER